jgi:hypothetical protein
MHEVIRIAKRTIPCDFCGQLIQKGEKFRFIKQEYGFGNYCEHICCPQANTVVTVRSDDPLLPKIKSTLALNMA